jgi:class 3 adenylate cyclase/DNA-binding CsgD family transcriptional regulator/tetratricopeptide (TPR) repeat protein
VSAWIAEAGVVTVVFVDVEGSTDLLQRVGDGVGTATVNTQLDRVRSELGASGGREVKSLGDGLHLTFASPRSAVGFALAAQRALADSMPRVRIGINTGEALSVDSDPLGSAVNAAARIAGRAEGGEVLVSDVVRQLVGTMPTVRFVDRGRHRLKGFAERWRLWAVTDGTGRVRSSATIGRMSELEVAAELLSATAAGAGRCMALEGAPGIGKTHLAREIAGCGRAAGFLVAELAADELVRRPAVFAHGLLDVAVPAAGTARLRLAELLATAADTSVRVDDLSFAIIEATVDVVEAMARSRPVLVVAEDLHWADELSLATLAAIVCRAGVASFAVVATHRPVPRPAALDRLLERIAATGGVHRRLGGLDEIDVHALATAVTAAAPGPQLRTRLRATAGNPLFVTELLRCLEDDGLLTTESGIVDTPSDASPMNLHQTLVRRLSWLSPQTNEALRLASLLGRSFTLRELASIAGRSVVDVAAWLRDATLSGLVIGDDDRLAFGHDLIRAAVYDDMLPAERRGLHRAAARALAEIDASAVQVARQYAHGATPGDTDAVAWLERAAVETLSVSPSAAVELFEEALTLAFDDWPGRRGIQARMIEPLVWSGRPDAAERLANEVLASMPPPQIELMALRGLGAAYGNRGQLSESAQVLNQAAAATDVPDIEARRLRCIAAQLDMMLGTTPADTVRTMAHATLVAGEDTGDATTRCIARQTLGVVATITGHGAIARDHFAAAVDVLDSAQVAAMTYLCPDAFLAISLLELDALEEAGREAARAVQRAQRRGALIQLPLAFGAAAGVHLYAGRWDDATAELEAGQAVMQETGVRTFVLHLHAAAAWIALCRGNLDAAKHELNIGYELLATGQYLFGADWLLGIQAELLATEGNFEGAVTVAEMAWTQTASLRYFYGYRWRGMNLVRYAVITGRDQLADAVTAELEEAARRTPAPSVTATAVICRALVDDDAGLAMAAVQKFRESPLRRDHARCCEDAASVLLHDRGRTDAVSLLRDAAAIHDSLGSSGDLARVDEVQRRLGVRRRQSRSRPTMGWEALTPTEAKVSELVADGLTNPEIGTRLNMSRRTVESHLSHTFMKLGLSSRTQLATALTRRMASTTSS